MRSKADREHEDDDVGVTGFAVVGEKGAAHHWLGLQEIEEVGAGRSAGRVWGLRRAEGGHLLGIVGDLLERVAAGLPVTDVGE
jgi:hypothetical protein